MEKEKKSIIIYPDRELLELLDNKRGDIPRTIIIRKLIQKWVNGEVKLEWEK
ncbi:MAG: hypothetical protein AB1779_00840 [Candidatus Thermoplasmatota archaeon]